MFSDRHMARHATFSVRSPCSLTDIGLCLTVTNGIKRYALDAVKIPNIARGVLLLADVNSSSTYSGGILSEKSHSECPARHK